MAANDWLMILTCDIAEGGARRDPLPDGVQGVSGDLEQRIQVAVVEVS